MANTTTKRVTIYDVANEAHVSLATVSRVMNNIGNVSEDTKALVDKAIIKLGYFPSNIARGLARQETTSVAIVLPSPNYSYISSMLSGMLDVCKIYGYIPSLFTYEDCDDAAKVVENVISSYVEGLVVFNSELSAADLHKMLKIRLPMVLIAQDNLGDNALVDMNFSGKLEEILTIRASKGLKNICYIKDPDKDWHMSNAFDKSIQNAIKNTSCKYNQLSIEESYNSVYDYFYNFFKKQKPNHEYYVASRDSVAQAIINAAMDLGYKVPEDIEVLCVIGTKTSKTTRPTISSIECDLYEVGTISMRMLTKMLANKLKDKKFVFETEYVKRESTLE